jgi:type IV pilus assembly protein PilE
MASRRQRGFTLIELMVAVAIIAILSRIAYSSYIKQVIKSNRTDAESTLTQAAQSMERWYATHDTYPLTIASTGYTQSPVTGTAIYNLSFVGTPTATTYTLQATPVTTGSSLNKTDGFLQLKQDGSKCWDKDNSGSCSSTENTWTQP